MREKNVTQKRLADAINRSESTLNSKLTNKVEFKPTEMILIMIFLGLDLSDIDLYFFCRKTCEFTS